MRNFLLFTLLMCSVIVASLTAGCRPSIPPASQFQVPAVGTLVPDQQVEAVTPVLSQNESGVFMINQTGAQVQIVVSSTIATIPAGSSFLFVLPPDTYQFYIYEPGIAPWTHTEATLGGKLRYVYLPLRGVPGTQR
jgi:hypothetical protein